MDHLVGNNKSTHTVYHTVIQLCHYKQINKSKYKVATISLEKLIEIIKNDSPKTNYKIIWIKIGSVLISPWSHCESSCNISFFLKKFAKYKSIRVYKYYL